MRSERRGLFWLMPLLIGLMVGATFSLPIALNVDTVSGLQLAAADTLQAEARPPISVKGIDRVLSTYRVTGLSGSAQPSIG